MTLMNWDDKMSVGVKSVDRQHQKLLSMVNDFYEGMASSHAFEKQEAVLMRLEGYATDHFRYEESLLSLTNYPYLWAHKQQHQSLLIQVKNLRARYQKDASEALSIEAFDFLMMWLLNHIMGEDAAYEQHFLVNGIQ